MNPARPPESDPVDAALRALAPLPLADDGFTERTMRRIGVEARRLAIARALVREEQRHQALRRLRRWTAAGTVVGVALLATACLLSPGEAPARATVLPLWAWWSSVLTGAVAWFAWNESRAG